MHPEESTQAAVADLIGHLYEAAFDATRWQQVVQGFADLVNATSGAGFLHNFDAAVLGSPALGGSFAVTHGMSDAALTSYAAHYGAINPWAAREDALTPGVAVSSSMLYPDHLLPRTEFYGDYLRHHDIFYSLGGVVDRTSSLALKFAFTRPRSQGAYQPHELALWQMLVPHVQRAARLHLRLQQQADHARDAEDVLAALADGLIVLNHEGRVQRLNEEARVLVGGNRGLTITGAGRLQVDPLEAGAKLQAAVRAALAPAFALQAPRETVQCQGSAGRLRLEVVALSNPSAHRDQSRCAILVSRPTGTPAGLGVALQCIYGMTPSEAMLTEALVEGLSLAEIAERRSVSIHTVRTQIKSASAKAGAKRQADLVRIVLTGPAVRPTRS